MAEAMELKRETTGETLVGSLMKFFSGAIGAKVTMAVTGLGLWAFTIGHMSGNLLAFVGKDAFNHYAATLQGTPLLLWPARLALLIGVPLHFYTALRTVQLNKAARPEAYAYQERTPVRLAARTMLLSGLVVGAFFAYHIAHFTLRVTGSHNFTDWVDPVTKLAHHDAYAMLVAAFQNPVIAGFYIVAQVLLAAHLSHGIYSLFQHLGIWGSKWTPFLKNASLVIGYGLCTGFAAIPLSVMLGIIK
jgi:succinate dehydrogenase / fumarate reductase cytochrome b subunit